MDSLIGFMFLLLGLVFGLLEAHHGRIFLDRRQGLERIGRLALRRAGHLLVGVLGFAASPPCLDQR